MESSDLNTPGKRIRFLRLAKGLTQEALGHQVDVSQAAVAQWEGDTYRPHPAIQRVLAEALGTTRAFLFEDAA